MEQGESWDEFKAGLYLLEKSPSLSRGIRSVELFLELLFL